MAERRLLRTCVVLLLAGSGSARPSSLDTGSELGVSDGHCDGVLHLIAEPPGVESALGLGLWDGARAIGDALGGITGQRSSGHAPRSHITSGGTSGPTC
jgi:hypothetical protein